MPVNPKKLIHHSHTFPVGDDTVTINFRRPSLAQLDEIRKALKAANKEDDQSMAVQAEYHLFPNIVSWDMVDFKLDDSGNPVLDKNGEPVTVPLPVTLETLINDIPGEIVFEMLQGVALLQTKGTDAGNGPSTP